MQIYFVYDSWDGTNVWDLKFYATKELADAELERRLVKLHEESEVDYQRKLSSWKIKNTALQAIIDAGLEIPSELSWVGNAPPEKKIFINSGLEVDYVEVIESE